MDWRKGFLRNKSLITILHFTWMTSGPLWLTGRSWPENDNLFVADCRGPAPFGSLVQLVHSLGRGQHGKVYFMSLPVGKLPAYAYAEYVNFEDANPARHEYIGGQILAMAGGTPAHARLQAAVLFALERRLEGRPCQDFPSDLRVRITATGMATYPDVTVVCGPVQTTAEDPHAALNPTLIVEVLSDRTSVYDCGEKFEQYRQVPTLQLYVLVSHRERRIETRKRETDGSWIERQAGRGETVLLEALGIEFTVDEIYDRSPLTSAL